MNSKEDIAARVAGGDLCGRLQQKCSDWGTYWRAPDAHGVILSQEQALELLRDALGLEVEVKPATARAGVDLEQFRTAVAYWRAHLPSDSEGRKRADRLLALIDANKQESGNG